jgi:hypothetical protein
MDGGLFGSVAAGHRARPNFGAAVIHVVIAIHWSFFGLCCSVIVGGDWTVIASAAGAAGYDQASHKRTLQQESRDEAEKGVRAANREHVRKLASEPHGRALMVSMIRQIR